MAVSGALAAVMRPPAYDADDLRLLRAGVDPRSALVDLKFTRKLYRIALGRPYVGDFKAAGGTYTGGAGFKTNETLAGALAGPYAANVLGETDAGAGVSEARTNLLTYSAAFNNAAWLKTRVSEAPADIAVPLRSASAFKIAEDATATNTHYLRRVGVADGQKVFSVYAKAAERSWLALGSNWATSQGAYFNLATGQVGTKTGGVSAGMVSAGDGWWRCWVAATWNAATNQSFADILVASADGAQSYTGDGSSGVYVFGAQLEAGSFPTPYIPTTSAIATRTADAAWASFTPPPSGWMFAEVVVPPAAPLANRRLVGTNGAANETPLVFSATAGAIGTYNGSADLLKTGLSLTPGSILRAAVTWDASGRSITAEGAAPASDANAAGLGTISRIYLGADDDDSSMFLNSQIRRCIAGEGRLSAAQLQAITA